MKICHLTVATRERIPRLVREVYSASLKGYINYIVSVGNDDKDDYAVYIGVRKPKNRLDRFGKLCSEVYKAGCLTNADIFQIHDPELLRYVRKLKRKGKKVIFDSHENYLTRIEEREWIPKPFRKLLNSIFLRYMKSTLSQVDVVLAVNEPIVASLEKYNPNRYLVTNFPVLRKRILKDDDKYEGFNLCYTGAVSSQWCLNEIVSVLNDINGVTTRICGVGTDNYLSVLESNPAWKRMDYLGAVSPIDALLVQEKSNVGLAILKYSNNTNGRLGSMGNTKLFEYFMSGIPVICTEFGCWRDIIDEYKCGICVGPDKPEEIKKAIITLRDNPEMVEIMGKNARRAAEETYNWALQGEKLLKIYQTLQ